MVPGMPDGQKSSTSALELSQSEVDLDSNLEVIDDVQFQRPASASTAGDHVLNGVGAGFADAITTASATPEASCPVRCLMSAFELTAECAAYVLHACHGFLLEAAFALASGGVRPSGLPLWTPREDTDVLSVNPHRLKELCAKFGQGDVCLRIMYLTGCDWLEEQEDWDPDTDNPMLLV